MKATGIVRELDELGRIVLPAELRTVYQFRDKDALEVFYSKAKQRVYLRKYEPGDIFTGSMNNLIDYKGRKVSVNTILLMANQANINLKKAK